MFDYAVSGNFFVAGYAVSGSGRATCGKRLGPLQPGELVMGEMNLTDPASNTWLVSSTRLKTGETSTQSSVLKDIVLNSAYLTVEAMIIYSCAAYPSSGSVTFSANALTDRTGSSLSPTWRPMIRHSECQQTVTTGTDVVISWNPNNKSDF